ncbi:hypothetical protein [Pseudomonas rossensis]|uniref:hypothetical protein n=1 Tax=Pseudomonas rossensis TaxID=2305471 RepID=UPI003260BFD9
MNDTLVVINAIEELKARPGFEVPLAFHPHTSRGFGSAVAPHRFLEKPIGGIAHCHQPHMAGYLITTNDGRETGIGANCGATHFGVLFTRKRKRVDRAIARRQIDAIAEMTIVTPTTKNHQHGSLDEK